MTRSTRALNDLERLPLERDRLVPAAERADRDSQVVQPLRDVRVRRALNLGTDVRTILRTVMAGRGVRAAGAIPPGILGYDSTRAPYPWDTAGARRLLSQDCGHALVLAVDAPTLRAEDLAPLLQCPAGACFDGLPLLEQHKLVNQALAAPFASGRIHEMRIKTRGTA